MPAPSGQVIRVVLGILVVVLILVVARARQSQGREAAATSDQDHNVFQTQRLLMGTQFKVTIWETEKNSRTVSEALAGVCDELAGLENRLSSWIPESETSRVNRAAGAAAVPVSPELEELLRRSRHWAQVTGGAFDVTGGPLFELWEEARERNALPTQEEIDRCRALTGHRHLELTEGGVRLTKPGVKLGFGAIAKGFAADRAADFLKAKGISNFLIDAGGDLLASGQRAGRAWRVAIRHPRRKEFLARFDARDCAIASSGDYERYFEVEGERYSHILDLRTGRPARHLTGVTVLARSAADADALATALFVMDASRGIELVEGLTEVEAILVDSEGKITLSSGLHLNGDYLIVDR